MYRYRIIYWQGHALSRRETIFLDYVFQSTSSVFCNFLKNIQDFIMELAICNLIILLQIRVGNSRSASDMESH